MIGFFKILKNFVFRKNTYRLSFFKEHKDNNWYYDFKYWPFDHKYLMMLGGASCLCEFFRKNNDRRCNVEIIVSNKKLDKLSYVELERFEHIWNLGATYHVNNVETINTVWICPVTLMVLGRYPKFIYVKSYE